MLDQFSNFKSPKFWHEILPRCISLLWIYTFMFVLKSLRVFSVLYDHMMSLSIAKACKKICMAIFYQISSFYHDEVQVFALFPILHKCLFLLISYNFYINRRKSLWLVSFDRSFKELSKGHWFFVDSSKDNQIMTCQSYHGCTGWCSTSYFAQTPLFYL